MSKNTNIGKKSVISYDDLASFLLVLFVDVALGLLFLNASITITGLICHLCFLRFMKKHEFQNTQIVTLTVLISLIVMVVIYYGYMNYYGAPYYLGNSDDYQTEYYAKMFAFDHFGDYQYVIHTLKHNYNRSVGNGFIFLMSFLVRLCEEGFGFHTVVFRIINIYFLLWTAVLIVKSVELYNPTKGINLTIRQDKLLSLIALFPSTLYITVHTFRDVVVLFIFAYLIYDIVSKNKSIYVKVPVYFFFMFLLRAEYCALLIVVVVGIMFYRQKNMLKKMLIVILGILGVVFILMNYGLVDTIANKMTYYKFSDIQGLSRYVFSLPLLPFGFFVRFIYGMVSPLPYLIIPSSLSFESIISVWRAAGTCYLLFLIPPFLKSIFKKSWVSVVGFGFLVVACISTFTFRHFICFYPFAIAGAYCEMQTESAPEIKNSRFLSLIILVGFLSMRVFL